jgi:hypothetical protein
VIGCGIPAAATKGVGSTTPLLPARYAAPEAENILEDPNSLGGPHLAQRPGSCRGEYHTHRPPGLTDTNGRAAPNARLSRGSGECSMAWVTRPSNVIYLALRSSARCAAKSTNGASSRPGRCTALGRAAGTRTTGSLQPRPSRRRQADKGQRGHTGVQLPDNIANVDRLAAPGPPHQHRIGAPPYRHQGGRLGHHHRTRGSPPSRTSRPAAAIKQPAPAQPARTPSGSRLPALRPQSGLPAGELPGAPALSRC